MVRNADTLNLLFSKESLPRLYNWRLRSRPRHPTVENCSLLKGLKALRAVSKIRLTICHYLTICIFRHFLFAGKAEMQVSAGRSFLLKNSI
jgi:hypothetical protein